MLFCLIGSTCSGKTTISNVLDRKGIRKVITYTTRPLRDSEVSGNDYYFISNDEFDTLNNMNYFAKISQFQIDEDTVWKYGTSKSSVFEESDNDRCLIIDPQNISFYKNLDNTLIIYLYASEEIIWNRLRKRGSGADDARRRITNDLKDFENIWEYVDIAINNDGTKSPLEIANIIKHIGDTYD